MIYGSLVDEVRFTENPPVREYSMNYLWRPSNWIDKVHMPDIHGTVWKNNEGTASAVVVANATSSERQVSFRLPCTGFAPVKISETDCVGYREADGLGKLVLPPHGIAFLKTHNMKGNK